MDALLTAITDVCKHYININYLTFNDKQLNMLLYTLICVFVNLLNKFITNFKLTELLYFIEWNIKYKFLKQTQLIFPIISTMKKREIYSPYDNFKKDTKEIYKNYDLQFIDICWDEDIEILSKIVWEVNSNYIYEGTIYSQYHSFNIQEINDSNDFKNKNKLNIKNLISGISSIAVLFARVNGYNIYINYREETDKISLCCIKREPITEFIKHIEEIYKHIQTKNNKYDDKKLKVFDTNISDKNKQIVLGYIKPQLNFDNFVSRYKENILKKLDAFKKIVFTKIIHM